MQQNPLVPGTKCYLLPCLNLRTLFAMDWMTLLLDSAWASETNVQATVNTGVWHAISTASPVVQLTLLLLVGMSVISWAITFNKHKLFRKIDQANEPFLDLFWKASSLDDIFNVVADHPSSSMANVFKAGYLELRKIADSNLAGPRDSSKEDSRPMLSGLDNMERALSKAIDSEVDTMESRLSFLATTGSTCPFIGLFGTVWGIMGSFGKIGQTGMASLAVVAPGISEALVATAIGLAAAIPATVAYNLYTTKLKKQELALSNFSSDFLNIVKRNFFIKE